MPTAGGLVGPPSAGISIILDHSCGKLASGQLSTCHETVEPRWACRGSDRGEPDMNRINGVPEFSVARTRTASQRLVGPSSAGMSIMPAANWRRGSSAHVMRL